MKIYPKLFIVVKELRAAEVEKGGIWNLEMILPPTLSLSHTFSLFFVFCRLSPLSSSVFSFFSSLANCVSPMYILYLLLLGESRLGEKPRKHHHQYKVSPIIWPQVKWGYPLWLQWIMEYKQKYRFSYHDKGLISQ